MKRASLPEEDHRVTAVRLESAEVWRPVDDDGQRSMGFLLLIWALVQVGAVAIVIAAAARYFDRLR